MKVDKNAMLIGIIIGIVVIIGFSLLFSKNDSENISNQSGEKQSQTYKNISVIDLKSYKDTGKEIFLLDVHIPEQQHIPSTDAFIPFNELEQNASKLPKQKDTHIVVYCRSGNMSETASKELINMGYTNVENVVGGISAWKAKGYDL